MTFCRKYFGVGAFESLWWALFIFYICEHLRALCEHLWALVRATKTKIIKMQFLWKFTSKCSWMIEDAHKVLVRCQNWKYTSRALKRTNSEVFWTNSRWERSIWNLMIFGCVLARFLCSTLNRLKLWYMAGNGHPRP